MIVVILVDAFSEVEVLDFRLPLFLRSSQVGFGEVVKLKFAGNVLDISVFKLLALFVVEIGGEVWSIDVVRLHLLSLLPLVQQALKSHHSDDMGLSWVRPFLNLVFGQVMVGFQHCALYALEVVLAVGSVEWLHRY